MGKRRRQRARVQPGTVRVRAYPVLARAVEEGIACGLRRAHKRPRNAPGATTLGVRLTGEQRAALEQAAGGLDLSTWLRELGLARAGRSDLGIVGEAARVAAALPDRIEQVRRETGRMPDDAGRVTR